MVVVVRRILIASKSEKAKIYKVKVNPIPGALRTLTVKVQAKSAAQAKNAVVKSVKQDIKVRRV